MEVLYGFQWMSKIRLLPELRRNEQNSVPEYDTSQPVFRRDVVKCLAPNCEPINALT
jgi:hypothetical protein